MIATLLPGHSGEKVTMSACLESSAVKRPERGRWVRNRKKRRQSAGKPSCHPHGLQKSGEHTALQASAQTLQKAQWDPQSILVGGSERWLRNCLGEWRAACTLRALRFGNQSTKENPLPKVDTAVGAQPLAAGSSLPVYSHGPSTHLSSSPRGGLMSQVTLSLEGGYKGHMLRKYTE